MEKRNREIDELHKLLKSETAKVDDTSKRLKELEKLKAKEAEDWKEKEKKMMMDIEAEATRSRQLVDQVTSKLKLQEDENKKLINQKKAQEMANSDLMANLSVLQEKCDKAEKERSRMKEDLESLEEKFSAEVRHNSEFTKANKKLETQLKSLRGQLEIVQKEKHQLDVDCKRREENIGELKRQGASDANLIAKLQANIWKLIKRIEELEDELEIERKARIKAERLRMDLQDDFDTVQQQMQEASGQLTAQLHLNSIRAEEVSNLQREIHKKNINRELCIADICSMQYITVNKLRTLSQQV
ncbi:unnamed protein product [Angiostrongylus costaricensis]|uniref:Myosin_tail_1 domain-containing protein n=1 Tax=Angiostrongylus costaricensis TaxID=334426 RepID=A0A0R3PJN6_ANGCS|nr:unnamed protein product [Angiostrongylus costaricensis]